MKIFDTIQAFGTGNTTGEQFILFNSGGTKTVSILENGRALFGVGQTAWDGYSALETTSGYIYAKGPNTGFQTGDDATGGWRMYGDGNGTFKINAIGVGDYYRIHKGGGAHGNTYQHEFNGKVRINSVENDQYVQLAIKGSGGYVLVLSGSSNQNVAHFTDAGRIGFGTISPSAALHVVALTADTSAIDVEGNDIRFMTSGKGVSVSTNGYIRFDANNALVFHESATQTSSLYGGNNSRLVAQNYALGVSNSGATNFISYNTSDTTFRSYIDFGTGINRFVVNHAGTPTNNRVGINTNIPNTTLDVNGAISTRSETYGTVSNLNDMSLSGKTFLRISDDSGSGIDITGFAGGSDGRILIISCIGGLLNIKHQNASSSAENRIIVNNIGGEINLSNGDSTQLIYDGITERWRAINM